MLRIVLVTLFYTCGTTSEIDFS